MSEPDPAATSSGSEPPTIDATLTPQPWIGKATYQVHSVCPHGDADFLVFAARERIETDAELAIALGHQQYLGCTCRAVTLSFE
jgi:hypothetical protein